jgi:hypothetical protein
MRLIFLSAQENGDLTALVEDRLLTVQEHAWLTAASIGTRPMLICGFVSKFIDEVLEKRPMKRDAYAFQVNGVLLGRLQLISPYL